MNTKYIIILFYDIPNNTAKDINNYTKFRKHIKSIGFIMLQKSVYVKKINNKSTYGLIKRDLKIAAPNGSNIRSLLVTENIYNKLELISGEETFNEKVISNKTRVLEL